jgi:signal peptidase II
MKLENLYKKKSLTDYIVYISVLIGGILIDQFTKWLVVQNMELYEHIPVIRFGDTTIASLLHIRNDGAAFGMLDNAPWVFNTISTVAIIAMTVYLFLGHTDSLLSGIALSMLISGGIGNMIDRISLQYVVDFIYLDIIKFAIFNGADSFVCVGAGLLMLSLILEMKKEMQNEKLKKAASAVGESATDEADKGDES